MNDNSNQSESINTGGGSYIGGGVNTGSYVGRDQILIEHLNTIQVTLQTDDTIPGAADLINQAVGNHKTQVNRACFLEHLELSWIRPLLMETPHQVSLMEIGFTPAQNAVDPTTDILPLMSNEAASARRIQTVFEEAGQSLLILGEAGAGKSTLLVELARSLAESARAKPERRLPLCLRLSSWGAQRSWRTMFRQPTTDFTTWVLEALEADYGIASKAGRELIQTDRLIYLLDGLDEIQGAAEQKACVQAINLFRQQAAHPAPMVICCRSEVYANLAEPLRLRTALRLALPEPEQVRAYLRALGPKAQPALAAFEQDAELQEMARLPLMLDLIVLACSQATETVAAVSAAQTPTARRQLFFDFYVRHMLHRRGTPPCSFEALKRRLGWLAKGLKRREKAAFRLGFPNFSSAWVGPAGWPIWILTVTLGVLSFSGLLVIPLINSALVVLYCLGMPILSIFLIWVGLSGEVKNYPWWLAISALLVWVTPSAPLYAIYVCCFDWLFAYGVAYARGYIPLNFPRFLDQCAEMSLLRKTSEGYVFSHALLFEHFLH